MYSTNDFLHYVFADYSDTYYTRGLQTLTLNEYLWFELHKESYDKVYYLTEFEKQFSVKTYGEYDSEIYNGLKLANTVFDNKKMENWMSKVFLSASNRCAVVCALTDFCNVIMKQKQYKSIINRLIDIRDNPKRTGILILVVPKYAEDSRDLFLKSPIFDECNSRSLCPTVHSIREKPNCLLYDELKKQKLDACIFLNRYNYDSVKSILIQAQIRCGLPKSFSLTSATELILNCMFSDDLVVKYKINVHPKMQFKDFYNYISKKSNWKKLKAATSDVSDTAFISYKNNAWYEVPVFRRNEVISGCLMLQFPTDYFPSEDDLKKMNNFKELLRTPINKIENETVLNKIKYYVNLADNADADFFRKLLFAVNNSSKLLYIAPNNELMKKTNSILERIDEYVAVAKEYADLTKTYSYLLDHEKEARLNGGKTELISIMIDQNCAMQKCYKDQLANMEIIIINYIVSLNDNETVSVEDLNQKIEECMNVISAKKEEYLTNTNIEIEKAQESEKTNGNETENEEEEKAINNDINLEFLKNAFLDKNYLEEM